MNNPQPIIPKLRQLAGLEKAQQELKKNHAASNSVAAEIESLRAMLPTSILTHYDARRARGKMGVAPVTRGICGSCHLSIPRGHLAELRREDDGLNVCENCGAFVYLEEEDQPVPADAIRKRARGAKTIIPPARAARVPKRVDGKAVSTR